MTTTEKLERLHNRGTSYELACTMPDGGKCLAGYTRQSKMGILTMIRKNGDEWTKRLPENAMIDFDKGGKSAKLGPFNVRFSGRTQREAIIAGELPFFIEAIPVA